MLQEKTVLPIGVTVKDPHGANYVIEGLLGKGGFSAVYVVRDQRITDNLFALKEVIDPNKLDRNCFLFEGEVLKRLDHRALPHVYSVFEDKQRKRVYMLMDYIEGRNLEDLRKKQPGRRFPLATVLSILSPIVDALSYLHSQDSPVVHRDIKPANIIVPAGGDEAILVDFGAAKEYDTDATTSTIRRVTPGYAALEQYSSGTNPRTDIYGLGATLYTLLTGKVPVDALVRATSNQGIDPLKPANVITPEVPAAIAQSIQRAMCLHIDDRFTTVEEFWQQLSVDALHLSSAGASQPLTVPIQDIETTAAAVVEDQRQAARPGKRPTLVPIFLALLMTAVIGTGFMLYGARHTHAPSTSAKLIPPSVAPGVGTTTPTLIPVASIYPSIAASYAGTIGDLMTSEKTNLFLTHIQQSQQNIRGFFQGLGLVGSFKGTITSSGHVQFTVTIYAGDATLSFEGTIKIGGDMAGTYEVLDQHGQRNGEGGIWSVASSS